LRKLIAIAVLMLATSAVLMGQQPDGQAQKQTIPAIPAAGQPEGDGVAKDAYKIGGNVSAPILVSSVDPEFSDYARRMKISGICLIAVIVDANGIPQHPRVIKSLEPSLDQNALAAINQYRFKPAMKDGQPVPVQIKIEVNFQLYRNRFCFFRCR